MEIIIKLSLYAFYLFYITLPFTYSPMNEFIEKQREKLKKKKARRKLFNFFLKESKDKEYYVISEYNILMNYLKCRPVYKRKLKYFHYRGEDVNDKYLFSFKHERLFDMSFFAKEEPILTHNGKVVRVMTTNYPFRIFITKDEACVKKVIDAICHTRMSEIEFNKHISIFSKKAIKETYKEAINTAIIRKEYS